MKKLILNLIRLYQKNLLRRKTCRFSPTCSKYSYQAIDKYGILKGSLLSLKRIFRCHPWSRGDKDPLPKY